MKGAVRMKGWNSTWVCPACQAQQTSIARPFCSCNPKAPFRMYSLQALAVTQQVLRAFHVPVPGRIEDQVTAFKAKTSKRSC
jgi:hypothetical protein